MTYYRTQQADGSALDHTDPKPPLMRPWTEIHDTSIRDLVHTFYGRVRLHQRLAGIFEARLTGRWDEHLEKMQTFWRAVLLKDGSYKGRPVPAHLKLKELSSSDFGEWLGVFRTVARDLFVADLADRIIEVAERIAQSLWMACFGFAGAALPQDLSSREA